MESIAYALTIFQRAAKNVLAYKRFLKRHRIMMRHIHDKKDFENIPVMDKKKYILKYNIQELFPRKKIPPMVYASSGSSGTPTFWFRGDAQEEIGAEMHEYIFRHIFGFKKEEPILAIICFSMGIWIAGGLTLVAMRSLARKGWNITAITPGIEKSDIFSVLRVLTPQFKRIVLFGYPPFLMDLVQDGNEQRIRFSTHTRFITAGDSFSEEWRTTLLKTLNIPKKNYTSAIVSIYGSADAGAMGHETPLSIFLRRYAYTHKELREALFGKDSSSLPGFVQFHPKRIFFEEKNGELLLTTNTASPLIRYNIHDRGFVLSRDMLTHILKNLKLEKEARSHGLKRWNMPFLVLKGRTDVAVTFYGLNIFPEHIKTIMDDADIRKNLSGTFCAYHEETDQGKKQTWHVGLELEQYIKTTSLRRLEVHIQEKIMDCLLSLNIDFRKLHSVLGKQALPKVHLYKYRNGHLPCKPGGMFYIKGKKPRIYSDSI